MTPQLNSLNTYILTLELNNNELLTLVSINVIVCLCFHFSLDISLHAHHDEYRCLGRELLLPGATGVRWKSGTGRSYQLFSIPTAPKSFHFASFQYLWQVSVSVFLGFLVGAPNKINLHTHFYVNVDSSQVKSNHG